MRIWSEAIAQTRTGTSRIRASVIRFGILKFSARLVRARQPQPARPNCQYSGDPAIAQS